MCRSLCRSSLLLLLAACLVASPASAGSARAGHVVHDAGRQLLQAYPG